MRRAFETGMALAGSTEYGTWDGGGAQPIHIAPFLAESGRHGDNMVESRDLSTLSGEDRRRIRVQTACKAGRGKVGGSTGAWHHADATSLRMPCGDQQPDISRFIEWLGADLLRLRRRIGQYKPVHLRAVSHANTLRQFAKEQGVRTIFIGNLASLRCVFTQRADGTLDMVEKPKWTSFGVARKSLGDMDVARCATTASGAKVFGPLLRP
jgi:hypothetical protein